MRMLRESWLARGTAARGWTAGLCWYGLAALGVACVTLSIALLQGRVDAGRLQMSYLLVVLALAIGGGSGPAILASLLAFVAFDWCFVKPVGNLIVGDPEEWFALGLFLLVGITTGSLAAGLKRSAAEARRLSRETSTLYALSTALLAGPTLEPVLGMVVERVREMLALRGAAIELARPDGQLGLVALSGETAGHGQADLRALRVPLTLNDHLLGVLTAYHAATDPPLPEAALRLLDAFAAQTALAVGRVRLIEEEERARAAEESDRLKSVFLASISHDLRTPITTIKTAAALLLTRPEREAAMDATITIDREADRLNQFVGNLLEMSRIEAESALPQRLPEDMSELVGAAAERMAGLLDGRRLELSSAADLPLALLDAPQMGRVLTNLLENAIKFSPRGSTIRVALSRAGGDVEGGDLLVRVHNAGAPIPPDDQRRVFDKFYRRQQDRTRAGGAGLGLAICKGIMEAHGGRIWTANEDDGVAFYLALPVVASASAGEMAFEAALP